MKITTTDGKEYIMPDGYSCCNMNTAGQHEWNCPMSENMQWLKVAEGAFKFWDNEIDDGWNNAEAKNGK